MTAEALSAAEATGSRRSVADDGPPRAAETGADANGAARSEDAAELAEARQSAVDVVTARLGQVAGPEDAVGTRPVGAESAGQQPAPADRVPTDQALADLARAVEAPAAGPAVDGPAVGLSPVDRAPMDHGAVDQPPVGQRPIGQRPVGQRPVGQRPVGQPPVGQRPVDQLPVGQRPVGRPPVGQPPVGRPPVRQGPVHRTPVDRTPGPEAPADQAPAEAAGNGRRRRPDVVAEVQGLLQPTGDPGRFAATAVLDVLRASGWADAEEADRLRGEADRLRELLDLVVRDHRARVASAAGLESQQHHWLIPLVRAAHGVAFGSLGAKVALRTAVQEVPENILATAGLHIDHGVEPASEAHDQH